MALSHLRQENFTCALECYDTTHAIFLQSYGLGSIQLAGLHCRVAECYRQQRDLTRSLTLCGSEPSQVALRSLLLLHAEKLWVDGLSPAGMKKRV